MLNKRELEFRSRACLAHIKLRVVVFSMAVGLPIWIGAWVLRKAGLVIEGGWIRWGLLLLAYLAGVAAIIARTQRAHGLSCPGCGKPLGVDLGKLTGEGDCKRCGKKVAQSPGLTGGGLC